MGESAADFLPERRSLRALREAAAGCRGCPLWADATQIVFGSGPPRAGEVAACRPWLKAELEAVEPRAVVALGATAARSLFGRGVKVTEDRGRLLESPLAPLAAVTIHPSAVLRVREREQRHAARAELAADLAIVARALTDRGSGA